MIAKYSYLLHKIFFSREIIIELRITQKKREPVKNYCLQDFSEKNILDIFICIEG